MVSQHLSVKQIKLLKQHKYIMKKLASSTVKDKLVILQGAPSELFIVLNLLFKLLNDKKLNLTKSQERKLNRHQQLIRTSSSLKGDQIRQKMIRYRSSALPTILKTILPVIEKIL